jgi:hypothetical protein
MRAGPSPRKQTTALRGRVGTFKDSAPKRRPMTAAAVDRAARALARHERRLKTGRRLTVLAIVLAALTVVSSPPLAIALAMGATFEAVVCLVTVLRRRALIARLAVEPDAYAIPVVREFGVRLADPGQRERLGRWLVEVLSEAGRPESLYLADRVSEYAVQIRAVAFDLMAPDARVQPVSVATCRRLLTAATESPLYNPQLPAVDLGSALFRIHAGISGPA